MTWCDEEDVFEGSGQSPGFHHRRSSSYISGGRDVNDAFDTHDEPNGPDLPEGTEAPSSPSPLPFSASFSDASSIERAGRSPGWRQVLPTQEMESATSRSSSRLALARRLEQVIDQLNTDDELDEHVLYEHLERMEQAMAGQAPFARRGSPSPQPRSQGHGLQRRHPASTLRMRSDVLQHRRPASVSLGTRSLSEFGVGGSEYPAQGVFKSRFSDLARSVSIETEEAQKESQREERNKVSERRITEANKIIAEANKLNEDLTTVVSNLKARQEEAEHIHGLLIERAERAAQRIIFLRNRISYLERELDENDDELQHLRICLKAVEIQLPPHPDKDLQRCFQTFKQDYQALKKKRMSRGDLTNFDSPGTVMLPAIDPDGALLGTVSSASGREDGAGPSQPCKADLPATPPKTQRLKRNPSKAENGS